MPIPSTMADLSTTAASNSPQGTDPVGNSLDDYLRSTQSIVRSMRAISSPLLVAAATTDLATSNAEQITVFGSTTITSLGTGFAGCVREVYFQDSLTLTHSANLLLPGGNSLAVLSGDVLVFRCLAAGQWVCVSTSRGTDPSKAPLASPAFTGTATINGTEIGFRGIPVLTQNAAYTFVASDRGQARVKTDANAYTWTVGAVHSAGDALVAVNAGSAGAITLSGSGVTLQLAGGTSTGNRTLAPGAMATVYFVTPTLAFVSGPGVS